MIDDLERVLKISSSYNKKYRDTLLQALQEDINALTWLATKMLGININVACYKLNIKKDAREIK